MSATDRLRARAIQIGDGLAASLPRMRDARDLARQAQRLRDLLLEIAVREGEPHSEEVRLS